MINKTFPSMQIHLSFGCGLRYSSHANRDGMSWVGIPFGAGTKGQFRCREHEDSKGAKPLYAPMTLI